MSIVHNEKKDIFVHYAMQQSICQLIDHEVSLIIILSFVFKLFYAHSSAAHQSYEDCIYIKNSPQAY